MEAVSSPMKRRAVLGSLDANAALSTTPIASKMIMMGSSMLLTPSALLVSSPLIGSESSKGKKRTAGEDDEGVVDESPVPKKTCVDGVSRLSFCLLVLMFLAYLPSFGRAIPRNSRNNNNKTADPRGWLDTVADG